MCSPSRIIVKNIPDFIKDSPEELKDLFATAGLITDFQLKYSGNKFRKFAFIGYANANEAHKAVDLFNKTYLGTSQISVNLSTDLRNKIQLNSNHIELKKSKLLQKHNVPSNPCKNKDFSLKINGLPPKTTKSQIIHFFQPNLSTTNILDVKIITTKTNLTKALIYLDSEESLRKGILKNKCLLKNRFIEVEIAKCNNAIIINDSKKEHTKVNVPVTPTPGGEHFENGRIFLRNLPYISTEDDIEVLFSKYGTLTEINLPLDKVTKQIKGYGFVTYMFPEHAKTAFEELDGTIYMGRMLHLIPAEDPKAVTISSNDTHDVKSSYKAEALKHTIEEEIKNKKHVNWNSLFVNANAVADFLSDKYEINKRDIYDIDGAGGKRSRDSAAVKIALAESEIVHETKRFLLENGVNLSAFECIDDSSKQQLHVKRSKNVILVKNLPANTKSIDLKHVFSRYGSISKIVLPPNYGMSALVVFDYPQEARASFSQLTHVKFNDQPLYLEWAPLNTFSSTTSTSSPRKNCTEGGGGEKGQPSLIDSSNRKIVNNDEDHKTKLIISNLNPDTLEIDIAEKFNRFGTPVEIYLPTYNNLNVKNDRNMAIISFPDQETAEKVFKELTVPGPDRLEEIKGYRILVSRHDDFNDENNNKLLMGRQQQQAKTPIISKDSSLSSSVNQNNNDAANRNNDNTKILVRNIPFQATPSEVKNIFEVFGSLKSVRLPIKQLNVLGGRRGGDSTNEALKEHKGFGFVEFFDPQSANMAFAALSPSTHLYGRRLVLEWATVKSDTNVELPSDINNPYPSNNNNNKKNNTPSRSISTNKDIKALPPPPLPSNSGGFLSLRGHDLQKIASQDSTKSSKPSQKSHKRKLISKNMPTNQVKNSKKK